MPNKIYTTMRGRKIDMGALAAANAEKLAIGNAKMNARGDILANNGVVLRTQEQIEAEWQRNQQLQNQTAGISSDIRAPLPADKFVARALQPDQNFEPDTSPAVPEALVAPTDTVDNGTQVKKIVQQRRKIIDSE